MTIENFNIDDNVVANRNLPDKDMGREQVVSGTNEEGNNQCYLNGEPVCGSCKVSYTNHGKQHPVGDGTDCPTCRAIDNEISYQDADEYWA